MHNKTELVNDFIQNLNHKLKPEIEEVRNIILNADKDITEHIKWNAPSFIYNGEDRITFRVSKADEIQLIFHRGAKVKDATNFEFEDPSGLIKWLAKDRGAVTFHTMKEIDENKEKLANLVNKWVKVS